MQSVVDTRHGSQHSLLTHGTLVFLFSSPFFSKKDIHEPKTLLLNDKQVRKTLDHGVSYAGGKRDNSRAPDSRDLVGEFK